ncbi:phosphohistidine phosphatase SixA [bacterium BMS3Abin03]|nr:phosphohistidine phosphatase SixA [bacterium BMS3Abin03]
MNIYLIRHGKAEPVFPGKKDDERNLTKEGSLIVEASANNWKEFVQDFDHIFTSPFIRAKQTARIISNVFHFQGNIVEDSVLAPGSVTRNIIELANAINGNDIAFIGHQPDMSYHISDFISGKEVNLKFSPSSIAKISFENGAASGKGILMFLLPPALIK